MTIIMVEDRPHLHGISFAIFERKEEVTTMRYSYDEKLLLQNSLMERPFSLDAEWFTDEDYPVFWEGFYDWIPPAEEYLAETA